MDRSDAWDILNRCKVPVPSDFHRLDSATVERLLTEADLVKYRRPANANGSRARYFHAMLQRIAARKA